MCAIVLMSKMVNEAARRQQELELKKAELARLKMERQMRNAARQTMPATPNRLNGTAAENGNGIRQVSSTQDMDQLLAEVGIAPSASLPANASAPNFLASNGHRDINLNRRPLFEIVHTSSISVQPKNDVKYSKVTQTVEVDTHADNFSTGSADGFEFDDLSMDGRHDTIDFDLDGSLAIDKILGTVKGNDTREKPEVEKEHVVQAKKPPPLTEQEKEAITKDERFQKFVHQASRMLERVMATDKEYDSLADYGQDMENARSDALLTLKSTFNNDTYLNNQQGRCVEFCEAHPELLAVAVNGDADGKGGPSGIINIWNTAIPTPSPEFVFHANDRIRSICFSRFHPKLVIGGCETGQICVWDMRNNRKIPVSRSQISARGHTQAVNGMHVVGTNHSHSMMTTSMDGIVCWWGLESMITPTHKEALIGTGAKKNLPIMSSDVFVNGFDKFVAGGEDGFLYLGERHNNVPTEFLMHEGPITSVALHKASGATDFSNYCLTGSMDFDMHLWNLQDQPKPDPTDKTSQSVAPRPVLSFPHKHGYSFITDVQWSPIHPAVFVSASMNGKFFLWNLNMDTENPVAAMEFGQLVSKVCWSRDGHYVVGLGSNGSAQLFEVHDSLKNVKPSEWDTLSGVLYDAVQDSKPLYSDEKAANESHQSQV
ncbi:unnamed protein product [Bursaphelenchus okinawaensis]|uniref:WD_REPEATS_REGION domain-containing protein n=1 Tax=Bursaphelenchus okinawaensis TaxID=465554 RepID=A0A811L7W2_9BILA|nr:unnamed protein product [Bursaphelenchus okinawaensis]CAG9117742.1 unnamed protein product [Bursaphelenchus okinawaensis]